jgi:hypothetical protein
MTKLITLTFLFVSLFSYSQFTGATPWENCYGKNASCQTYPKDGYLVGCSEINIKTSSSSSVVAIVKRYDKVIKHAFISSDSNYAFEVANGTYQVFFYYGKSWDRNKKMNSDQCARIYGGFTKNESVSKDSPITLNNQIMSYTLTQVSYGNFSPKSSDLNEAL